MIYRTTGGKDVFASALLASFFCHCRTAAPRAIQPDESSSTMMRKCCVARNTSNYGSTLEHRHTHTLWEIPVAHSYTHMMNDRVLWRHLSYEKCNPAALVHRASVVALYWWKICEFKKKIITHHSSCEQAKPSLVLQKIRFPSRLRRFGHCWRYAKTLSSA